MSSGAFRVEPRRCGFDSFASVFLARCSLAPVQWQRRHASVPNPINHRSSTCKFRCVDMASRLVAIPRRVPDPVPVGLAFLCGGLMSLPGRSLSFHQESCILLFRVRYCLLPSNGGQIHLPSNSSSILWSGLSSVLPCFLRRSLCCSREICEPLVMGLTPLNPLYREIATHSY